MAEAGAWRVMRQDDNGNRFVVAEGLSQAGAARCVEDLTARGHKQSYWAEPQLSGEP